MMPFSGPSYPDYAKDEGLEVIECSTAEAAELVISTAGSELLALVTDVNLDGMMTGVELANYARLKLPTLTVIVLSGKPAPNSRATPFFWPSLMSQPSCLPRS
jgi:CheY-like chemotaxis protein